MTRTCIAIVGSGTAGHVQPALATALWMREHRPDLEVFFVGSARGQETELVPAAGFELETVAGAPYYGVGFVRRLTLPAHAARGATQARAVLRRRGARLLLSFGGYLSFGAGLAAASLSIPVVVHEANATAGLANRVVGRWARRVCVAFPAASGAFAARKVVCTGTPVRTEFCAASGRAAAADGRRVPREPGPWRILVSGGSLGSAFLNRHVPEALALLLSDGVDFEVEHHTAGIEHEAVEEAYRRAGIRARVLVSTRTMAEACRRAEFAVTRAGALTVAELAACAVPALLVPLPGHAGGHQEANARACAAVAGTWWVREAEWSSPAVARRLGELLRQPPARERAAAAIRALAAPGAACAVASECEAVLAG